MANCNTHFEEYNGKIRLTDTRRKSLIGSRNELRNKVRKWFKENKPNETKPKFSGQGSMSIDTIINPIPRRIKDGNEEITALYYDVDDGIYFQGDKEPNDRPTPTTYHSWIYNAVKGHTDKDPIDKNTCIRTLFADGHNIDQPIYYKKGDTPQLAHKEKGWIDSDPKAFIDWFEEKVKKEPQLRRLVRYGKSWCDNREFVNTSKSMPCGLIITILFAENAVYRKDRDDVALKETLLEIQRKLKISFECKRPTTPKGENLLANYGHKDYFMDCLAKFIDDATKALQEKNFKKATELWRKHLSDRFPLGEDKDDSANASAGLGTIITPTTKPYAE
ncbi:MAG: cyclic GMP-AMP synthase DncV-like nucleotidyltransferase [Paludibacteraceae bacterium]